MSAAEVASILRERLDRLDPIVLPTSHPRRFLMVALLGLCMGPLLFWLLEDPSWIQAPFLLVLLLILQREIARSQEPRELRISAEGLEWLSVEPWTIRWNEIRAFQDPDPDQGHPFNKVEYVSQRTSRFDPRPDRIPSGLVLTDAEVLQLLRRHLARARGEPALPAAEPAARFSFPPVTSLPWATFAAVLLLCIVFWAELHFPITPADSRDHPSLETLIGLGGLNRARVFEQGELYRLFAGAVMHSSLSHLLSNAVALVIAGWVLERRVGSLWFSAIYLASAAASDVGSLVFNGAGVVSTGASGSIMGLLAAALAVELSSHGDGFGATEQLLGRLLIPALIPFGRSVAVDRVDVAAHIGGALGGLLLAILLLRLWKRGEPLPARRPVAVLVGLAAVCFAGAVWVAAANRAIIGPTIEAREIERMLARDEVDAALRRAEALSRSAPQEAQSWVTLAAARFDHLDMREAADALAEADRRKPGTGDSRIRGIALFYAGAGPEAIEALQRYIAKQPDDLYGTLWLEIVKLRTADPTRIEGWAGPASAPWPAPVLRLFAGDLNPEQMLKQARDTSPPVGEDYVCESRFYLAIWRTLRLQRSSAWDDFTSAVRMCPPSFVERTAARVELRDWR